MTEWNVHSALINSFEIVREPGLTVAYEQRPTTPPADGSLYYALFNLPAGKTPRTLGMDGQDEYTGVFQVDVVGPNAEGVSKVVKEASRLSAFYTAGRRFSKDGQEVIIRRSQISQARPDGVHLTVSVSIYWTAYINR